jgi:hypothetical protein
MAFANLRIGNIVFLLSICLLISLDNKQIGQNINILWIGIRKIRGVESKTYQK